MIPLEVMELIVSYLHPVAAYEVMHALGEKYDQKAKEYAERDCSMIWKNLSLRKNHTLRVISGDIISRNILRIVPRDPILLLTTYGDVIQYPSMKILMTNVIDITIGYVNIDNIVYEYSMVNNNMQLGEIIFQLDDLYLMTYLPNVDVLYVYTPTNIINTKYKISDSEVIEGTTINGNYVEIFSIRNRNIIHIYNSQLRKYRDKDDYVQIYFKNVFNYIGKYDILPNYIGLDYKGNLYEKLLDTWNLIDLPIKIDKIMSVKEDGIIVKDFYDKYFLYSNKQLIPVNNLF